MKKFLAIAFFAFSLGLYPSPAKMEASSFPKQLPIFEVKGYYNFSDHVDALLQAFYGDSWTSLKYKKYKGVDYWVADKKEAHIYADRFSLRSYDDISCYRSNMPGVRLSSEADIDRKPGEKIVDSIPGVYTFPEAQELVKTFIEKANIPLENYRVSFVSSEDPTMTKERSHYYFICFVPTYAGIPLWGYSPTDGLIEASITDEGLADIYMNDIPQNTEEIGIANIIDPSKIELKNLTADHQRIADNILNQDKEVLDILSEEELFASDGSVYTQQITKLTPKWTLLYAIKEENGTAIIKPIWNFSAEEFKQYERGGDYILFDAQTGLELQY